jgi:hypothetical protein
VEIKKLQNSIASYSEALEIATEKNDIEFFRSQITVKEQQITVKEQQKALKEQQIASKAQQIASEKQQIAEEEKIKNGLTSKLLLINYFIQILLYILSFCVCYSSFH